jgi:hypothetical protein
LTAVLEPDEVEALSALLDRLRSVVSAKAGQQPDS